MSNPLNREEFVATIFPDGKPELMINAETMWALIYRAFGADDKNESDRIDPVPYAWLFKAYLFFADGEDHEYRKSIYDASHWLIDRFNVSIKLPEKGDPRLAIARGLIPEAEELFRQELQELREAEIERAGCSEELWGAFNLVAGTSSEDLRILTNDNLHALIQRLQDTRALPYIPWEPREPEV